MKCASSTGLGIAYAGMAREEVMDLLIPIVEEGKDMMEVCMAGLSMGMVFVGTCEEGVGCVILQRLMESTEEDLNHSYCIPRWSRCLYPISRIPELICFLRAIRLLVSTVPTDDSSS